MEVVLRKDDEERLSSTDMDPLQLLESEYRKLLGKERLRSEIRQLGGLMLALGIGAAFSTFALIAWLVEGKAGHKQVEGFNLPILVGNLLQAVCGLTAMGTGVVAMLSAPLSQRFHTWSKLTVAIINLGPVTFVITAVRLIQGANDPPEANTFIPVELDPSQTDIRFCAAMGVLVLISVCASLIGGLTVLGLHLCACLGRQPHSRHRAYHVIRLGYYSLLAALGGLSQLILGAYLWNRFGFGPYEDAVHVAAFTIHFPLIAVLVGSLQTIYGVYGLGRATGHFAIRGPSDHSFLKLTFVVWIASTFLQFVFQPAYDDDHIYNAEGPTVACVYIGFFAMPAFLEYLVRTVPIQPRPEYYGLSSDAYYKEDFPTKWMGMVPKSGTRSGDSVCHGQWPVSSSKGSLEAKTEKNDGESSHVD
jgi:Ca2+/Na+ antiporter